MRAAGDFPLALALLRGVCRCFGLFGSRRFGELCMTLAGLWAMLTPLLLWVAWTREIFLFVLLSGFCGCVVYCVLARLIEPPRGASPGSGT